LYGDDVLLDTIKGKYRIVREIARSNDIVYEAVDTTLGRKIALKELNIAPGMDGQPRRERVERFNREAHAAGRLSHPNIVAVFDYGEENGRHFIAMEYLEGQNLRDRMQARGTFSVKEAIEIASQVLDALAYAHANRVIHRDIKPDNIHILPGSQVKLTDFGIARLTDQPALTSNGQIFGTPSYMSPEQIIGKEIDTRSDLFSVGIVLYEMLAGRKPFTGDSVVSITYAIMNAEPSPIPGIPPILEQIIRRALSKHPQMRPATAEQMKSELKNVEQFSGTYLPQTNMTGMGGVQLPAPSPYPSNGYGTPAPSMPPLSGGYAPPVATPYPSQSAQPWSWNNAGTGGHTSMTPPPALLNPSVPSASYPGTGVQGQMPPAFSPYAAPPFPVRPAEPLIRLTPGQRTTLVALLVAVVLGTVGAFGVIGFLKAYEQNTVKAKTQQVIKLINQGVDAYNTGDYASAVKFFEQAREAKPSGKDKETIRRNLSSAYIQLGRVARSESRLQDAQASFRKALAVDPDNRTAHLDLADTLDRMGQAGEARKERAAASGSRDTSGAPEALDSHSVTPGGDDSVNTDPNQFVEDRQAQAMQIIAEGDNLYRQGDMDGARGKWREAMGVGAGTSARDEAKARLDQTQTSSPRWEGFD
jgi:eukaryotic-like serine/threonine-protein kinase